MSSDNGHAGAAPSGDSFADVLERGSDEQLLTAAVIYLERVNAHKNMVGAVRRALERERRRVEQGKCVRPPKEGGA